MNLYTYLIVNYCLLGIGDTARQGQMDGRCATGKLRTRDTVGTKTGRSAHPETRKRVTIGYSPVATGRAESIREITDNCTDTPLTN